MTKQDHLEVIAGTDLDETYYLTDKTTGTWVDWTVGTWHVECSIRNRDRVLLARIANFGARVGEITLLTEGRARLLLPGSVTAGLPITRTYTNSTDQRLVGWRNRRPLFFDIKATETVSNDVSGPIQGLLTVSQPVSE